MTYGAFLIGHPLFWAALTGASFGGALATATRSARRDRSPERARSRKWIGVTLWTTFGVTMATCGILIPDGLSFLESPSLYAGAGWLVFIALALRFPRAGGIPVFFIFAAAAAFEPFLMRPFVPLREEGVAATVRLLAVDQSAAYVEISDHTPGKSLVPHVITTEDPTVVARAHQLQISDYLFFFGARGGIAFATLGNTGLDLETHPTAGRGTSVDRPEASIYTGMEFIHRVIDLLPLLNLTVVESDPVRLTLLKHYEIIGIPGAGIHLRAVVGSD